MNTYRKRGKQRSILTALSLFGLGIFALFVSPMTASAVSSQELFNYWANIFSDCPRQENPALQIELLAKAPIDECFYSVGDPRNQYLAKTCDNGTWKVNGGQLWGLAKSGNKLWIGTIENPICTAMGMSGVRDPLLTDCTVCEFGQGPWCPPISEELGDWRPPSIYVYNLDAATFTRKAFLIPGSMGGIPYMVGIRGGGAVNGIVFLAGPSGITDKETAAVILFAYNSETEEFLGWHKLKDSAGIDYKNTRKWLTFNGHLYASIWVEEGGGRILRWLGNTDAIKRGDYTTLWDFEEVGVLDQAPSNIAVYDGKRLAVATRPVQSKRILRGGEIWLSPKFANHLTADDAENWKRVWTAADYEPDFVTAVATAVGDLRFFDGYLWWGTEVLLGQAWRIHRAIYKIAIPGYPSEEEDLAAFYGTWRPTALFRGRNLGARNEEIDLVYGFSDLPKFTFTAKDKSGEWQIFPNRMGKAPLQGQGGFCNWYQLQAYSMAVYNDQLFVGTNEYSHRISQALFPIPDFPMPQPPDDESLWGAELWRFPNADSPAIAESTSGMGNNLNSGVRNMISDDALYLGVGNTNNLATDPNDDLPEGGWELIKLK